MPVARHASRFARWLGATALCASALGCAGSSGSQLERGETVESGEQRFDAYFTEVATYRDKVEGFDSDMFPVREPLTKQLEADVDVSMSDLVAQVRDRAAKLRAYGLTMSLVLEPEPRMLTIQGNLEADMKDQQVVAAIEESARRAHSTFRELVQLLGQGDDLERKRAEVAERLDKLDSTSPNRDLIEDEIVGAGRVITSSKQKLLRDSRTLALYLMSLADAADTGAATAKQQECEEAIAGKPRTKPGKPAKPGKPQPGGTPPTPGPPAGGDDFEM
jgi:hypothetical protein